MALESGRWVTRRDLPVWIALAVLLVAGWGLKSTVDGRMIAFADPQSSLRVRYPAGWLPTPNSTALLDVRDPLSGAGVPTTLIVTREPLLAERRLDQIVRAGILTRMRQLDMYRELSARPVKVAGKDAVAVSYAFVADPHETVLEAQRIPVVVRGMEYVVPTGTIVYRIDFRAADGVFDAARPTLERILQEIQL